MSSILDHEVHHMLNGGGGHLQNQPQNPLQSRLQEGMSKLSVSRPGCFDPYGRNALEEEEGGEGGGELDGTSTTLDASSSNNTTVVAALGAGGRLEVSDR